MLIPAGEFEMGLPSDEEGRSSEEGPVHHVEIENPFYMGKYEVTQEQWRAIKGYNPSKFTSDDNLPVERVIWVDVQDFITKLNDKEGTTKYRLPSEAEWEYACRAAGTKIAVAIKLSKIVLRYIKDMLKIFTVKYEERTESFNDSVMSNFLADKEILRWESPFFERKNEYFWSGLVEYRPLAIAQTEPIRKTEKSSRNESYKELLTENDLPLFNTPREWRAERSKEEGILPDILCNNTQLAKNVTILSP